MTATLFAALRGLRGNLVKKLKPDGASTVYIGGLPVPHRTCVSVQARPGFAVRAGVSGRVVYEVDLNSVTNEICQQRVTPSAR